MKLISINWQKIRKLYEPRGFKVCQRCSVTMYGIGKYCYTCKDILAEQSKAKYYEKRKQFK